MTIFRGATRVVAMVGMLGAGSGVASAQSARTIYASVTFDAEAGPVRTTACLQLTERVYPSAAWWENAANASGPDRAFTSVIAAIKQKDRGALVELTDPAQARDTARFDQQAGAFFQQFDSIRLVAVPRAYEFDGLVVFFGEFQSASQTAFVPLAFAREGEDSFGFLPSRMNIKTATFAVVNDWFAPSGSAPVDTPSYCADSDVKRATHRVSLVSSPWRPSSLLLTGASLDAPGPFTFTADKRLVWTNSSHITVSDVMFKQGPLFAAAGSKQPFSGVVSK